MKSLPAQNTTSISQPIPAIDRALSDAVASIMNTVQRVGNDMVAGRLPPPELRIAIKVRLGDLHRALLPLERSIAEKERAARAVAAMLSGWVNARVADPAAKVSAYVVTLGDLPVWAVEQVCAEVARGHVDGLDPDFPPSAARLHQLGEEAIARLRKEAADLVAVNSATLEARPPSQEERARIGAKLMDLKEELQGRSDGGDLAAKHKVKFEQNAAELARQQARVKAEYAEAGIPKPASPLALSLSARRTMAAVDAERNGKLPMDGEAAE
jgi:hypothetical protein